MQPIAGLTQHAAFATIDETLAWARLELESSPGHRTTVLAMPAPAAALHTLPEAFVNETAILWMPARGASFVGVGEALAVRASGEARLRETQEQLRSVELSSRSSSPRVAPQPRFFGGCAFQPGSASATPWTAFGDSLFFLPRLTYVEHADQCWLLLAVPPEPDGRSRALRLLARALRVLHGLEEEDERQRPESLRLPSQLDVDASELAAWCRNVEQIRELIASGQVDKIVAARRATVQLARQVSGFRMLTRLTLSDGASTRFALRVGGSTFAGVSPECLVHKYDHQVSADALAGTSAPGSAAELSLLGGAKERQEHELVVAAIVAALTPYCERVSHPTSPSVRRLRDVQHLHTPVTATLRSPRHVLELLGALHPTPAVAGSPRSVALRWIAQQEPAARGWYAGPIGWFDAVGDGEFMVALRSALLEPRAAHLFAGAGIVSRSDPEAEYGETQLKMKPMLSALTCG